MRNLKKPRLSLRMVARGRMPAARLDRDARNLVRDVRLLEPCDLLVTKRELFGRKRLVEVLGLRRADDWRGDTRLVQQSVQ